MQCMGTEKDKSEKGSNNYFKGEKGESQIWRRKILGGVLSSFITITVKPVCLFKLNSGKF